MQAVLGGAEFVEWRCCECGKGFAGEKLLRKYIPGKHKINIVKTLKSCPEPIDSRACPDCGKVLKTVQVVKSHIADKHEHADQYICTDGRFWDSDIDMVMMTILLRSIVFSEVFQLCKTSRTRKDLNIISTRNIVATLRGEKKETNLSP